MTHQLPASPFKPVDYMDRIDVFGYRWLSNTDERIISKYLVVEIKKGNAQMSDTSNIRDYEQLMKYVDWICSEYAHGDYSMIEAYLLAYSFDFSSCESLKAATSRAFVKGHQAVTYHWDSLSFVEYRVESDGTVIFHQV